jgi:hypothetical protein
MKKGRSEKYGRCLSSWVNFTIQSLPDEARGDYKARLLDDLKKYPFAPRKRGSPPNEGGVHELSTLESVEIENPEHLARLVKEGIHLIYQKGTASIVLNALLKKLE